MDKLQYVEPADLGRYELSDGEEEAPPVHVVKASAATRRTRVLKGVKLDKTFEPPSHYMCECVCSIRFAITLVFRRSREVVDSAQITEYDMDSDDCCFVQK